MPSDYRTPTVTSIGGRDGTVRSADGLIDLQVALPREVGGPGGKTNPEELFAAGYAACFHSAVKGAAAEKKGRAVREKKVSPAKPERHGKGIGGPAPPKTGKTRGRQRGKSGE